MIERFRFPIPIGPSASSHIIMSDPNKYACMHASQRFCQLFLFFSFQMGSLIFVEISSLDKLSSLLNERWTCLFCANIDDFSELFVNKNQMEIYVNESEIIQSQFWEMILLQARTHTKKERVCVRESDTAMFPCGLLWLFVFFCPWWYLFEFLSNSISPGFCDFVRVRPIHQRSEIGVMV